MRARPSRTSAGTWIAHPEGLEQPIVSAVTHSEDEVVFSLRNVPDRPGTAAAIFDAIAAEHVNVDTILQNVVHDAAELSFSVPQDDVSATRRALAERRSAIGHAPGGGDLRPRKGLARRGRDALAPRRRRPDVPHARRRGHQPASHLDVADQGVLPHPARRRRRAPCAHCMRRSRWASSRLRPP